MKITVFAPKPYWFNEGQPKVLKEHNKRMDLEIYCTDPTGKECGNYKNVHVYKSYTNAYLFCPKLFCCKKTDKILAHGYTTFLSLIALFKCKELYFMPHYHPIGSSPLFKLFRTIYDPTIGKLLFNKSKKIFCVSEFEKKEIVSKFQINPKKIIVIYNGIDLNKFNNSHPYFVNKKIILYVGRFEKYKNIQLLMKAMKYLPDYELKIIGSGPYLSELKKILIPQIEIIKNLSDSEVARWYKTCSVFVTLSDIEAFGLTVVEALASGKPVVVNDATSLSEFADKYNCVKKIKVHKQNSIELAKLIEQTSKIKIKNVDLSDYNWDKICKEIESEVVE